PYAIHHGRHLVQTNVNELASGRVVRLGAYGDPAAVPFDFWHRLLDKAKDWLGYTHQWRTCDQRLKQFCMASVDSRAEYDEAHDAGWRTYFVGKDLDDMPPRVALCPASAAAGKKLK